MFRRLFSSLVGLALAGFVFVPEAEAANTKPLMGAAAADNASFDSLNTIAGRLAARRTYNRSVPSSFSRSTAAPDVSAARTSYWSFKPDLKTFPSDAAAQSAFSSFLNTIPAGHRTVIVAWHEPEDNIKGGQFTLAQWGATNNRIGEIIRSKKRPELRHGICLMGPWTFDSRSPYYSYKWESVLDFSLVDVVGIDPYKFRTTDPSLQQMLTRANSGSGGSNPSTMQKLTSWGKPIALMEWGAVTIDVKSGATVTNATRATWITEAYAWMNVWNANNPVKIEAALYFHLRPSGGPYLSGSALTAFATATADSRQ